MGPAAEAGDGPSSSLYILLAYENDLTFRSRTQPYFLHRNLPYLKRQRAAAAGHQAGSRSLDIRLEVVQQDSDCSCSSRRPPDGKVSLLAAVFSGSNLKDLTPEAGRLISLPVASGSEDGRCSLEHISLQYHPAAGPAGLLLIAWEEHPDLSFFTPNRLASKPMDARLDSGLLFGIVPSGSTVWWTCLQASRHITEVRLSRADMDVLRVRSPKPSADASPATAAEAGGSDHRLFVRLTPLAEPAASPCIIRYSMRVCMVQEGPQKPPPQDGPAEITDGAVRWVWLEGGDNGTAESSMPSACVQEVTLGWQCVCCLRHCISFEGLQDHMSCMHGSLHVEWRLLARVAQARVRPAARQTPLQKGSQAEARMLHAEVALLREFSMWRRSRGAAPTSRSSRIASSSEQRGWPARATKRPRSEEPRAPEEASETGCDTHGKRGGSEPQEAVTSLPGQLRNALPPLPPSRFQRIGDAAAAASGIPPRPPPARGEKPWTPKLFHCRTACPMTAEEVEGGTDTDDEPDFQPWRRMCWRSLAAKRDLAREECWFFQIWNEFLYNNRLLADHLTPQACLAFCQKHGPALKQQVPRRLLLLHLHHLADYGVLPPDHMLRCLKLVDSSPPATPPPPLPAPS